MHIAVRWNQTGNLTIREIKKRADKKDLSDSKEKQSSKIWGKEGWKWSIKSAEFRLVLAVSDLGLAGKKASGHQNAFQFFCRIPNDITGLAVKNKMLDRRH